MVQTITVKRNASPRLAVQAGGLILCVHEFTLRQGGQYFWSIEDDNVKDQNPEDLDSKPQTDLHPIAQALKNHNGIVLLRWIVDMAALQSAGELYDVTLALVQDDDFKILDRYTNEDGGFGPLTSARHETGWAILNVS